jgi:uncharacterized protein
MKTQGWLFAGLLVLGTIAPAAAYADTANPPGDVGKPEKLKDIRRLLDLTGSGKLGMQVMGQMIQQFKQMLPNVPVSFWNEFQKEANADELVNLIVPIYDRHLSHAEIKDIIKFYETPTGKKFVSVLPAVTQESMDAGRSWGMQLATRLQTRLKEKGYQK